MCISQASTECELSSQLPSLVALEMESTLASAGDKDRSCRCFCTIRGSREDLEVIKRGFGERAGHGPLQLRVSDYCGGCDCAEE